MKLIKFFVIFLISLIERSMIMWMANPQTTENTEQVIYGAVKIEVASDANFTSPVDIGAANGVKLTEETKIVTAEADNVVDRDMVSEQTVTIEYEQIQVLNDSARDIMRGSLDTKEVTAGTLVSGATQILAAGWDFDTFIPMDNWDGDGTAPTIASVVQATATSLVEGTDYHLIQDAQGRWGIMVIDNATTDNTKVVTITYSYTPNATVTYYTGGKSEVPYFYVRLTNIDDDGQIVRWTMLGKCNIISGDEITFKKYNADDTRISVPVKIKVRQDTTLTRGKQLYKREVIAA